MRGVVLAVVGLALAGCGRVAAPPAPAWPTDAEFLEQLQVYRDRDLGELSDDEQEEVRTILRSMIRNTQAGVDGRRIRYVWAMEAEGQPTEWVVVTTLAPEVTLNDANDLILFMDTTAVRFIAFDAEGLWKGDNGGGHVSLGPKGKLKSGRLMPNPDGYPIIVFEAETGRPNYARQYYAQTGNGTALIRIEDPAGKAMRNDYRTFDSDCGPNRIAIGPPSDVEGALSSLDRTRVLEALVWLGGQRRPPPEVDPDKENPGHRMYAVEYQMIKGLLTKPSVLAKLKELSADKDPWVREQATLALTASQK